MQNYFSHRLSLLALAFLIPFPNLLAQNNAAAGAEAAPDPVVATQMDRGRLIYIQRCLLCHQVSGQGNAPSFPPLAKSDFLASNIDRVIRGLCEGLTGQITVNGVQYNGGMPAQLVTDAEAADVLTFVLKSWGNEGPAITTDRVKQIRAQTNNKTYEELVNAFGFKPLPKPPEGWMIREVMQTTNHNVRLLVERTNATILALGAEGDVWRVDTASGRNSRIVEGASYLEPQRGNPQTLGFCYDSERRMYVTSNRQLNQTMPFMTNEVTVYRSQPLRAGAAPELKPWFRVNYPWGVGPFNHGVSCIGQGPDGFIYVSSGSRTDGNEAGTNPRFYTGGEVHETACIWKLDPKQESPVLMIHARGVRNPFGFTWDKQGRMLATDNGPDADAAEELNVIEGGKHYGFPFQFSNWTNKPYAYTPDAPAGTSFTRPVANLGPAAGGSAEGLYTFHPHSSPAGIVQLDDSFPEGWRGKYLITRFGNLLQKPQDSGYDLIVAELSGDAQSGWKAKMDTMLAPLARPMDVIVGGPGKVYLVEYTRTTDFKSPYDFPGRILELAVKPK